MSNLGKLCVTLDCATHCCVYFELLSWKEKRWCVGAEQVKMVRGGVQRKLFEVKNNHRTSFEDEHMRTFKAFWMAGILWCGRAARATKQGQVPETPTLRWDDDWVYQSVAPIPFVWVRMSYLIAHLCSIWDQLLCTHRFQKYVLLSWPVNIRSATIKCTNSA